MKTAREAQFQANREAILRTAAQALNELGAHRASMNDLAARLKVTKPTLYYYFENKDDLLHELYKLALDRLLTALDEIEKTEGSGRDKVEAFFVVYMDMLMDDYGKCVIESWALTKGLTRGDEIREIRRTVDRRVLKLIESGIRDGSIAPCRPNLLLYAMFGAFNWVTHWYHPERGQNSRAIARTFLDFFFQGVGGQGGKAAAPAGSAAPVEAR